MFPLKQYFFENKACLVINCHMLGKKCFMYLYIRCFGLSILKLLLVHLKDYHRCLQCFKH